MVILESCFHHLKWNIYSLRRVDLCSLRPGIDFAHSAHLPFASQATLPLGTVLLIRAPLSRSHDILIAHHLGLSQHSRPGRPSDLGFITTLK